MRFLDQNIQQNIILHFENRSTDVYQSLSWPVGTVRTCTAMFIRQCQWFQCRCISCQYGINSLVVLALFTIAFITLIVWHGRTLMRQCGNATLRKRIGLLLVIVPAVQIIQLGACSLSLLSHPLAWMFEISRLVAFLCVCTMLLSISIILVIIPLRSAQRALQALPMVREYHRTVKLFSISNQMFFWILWSRKYSSRW